MKRATMDYDDDDHEALPGPSPAKKPKNVALALPPCKYGASCTRKNPVHFTQYSHPVVQEEPAEEENEGNEEEDAPHVTLPTCKYGASCFRKNADHLRQFYHPPKSASSSAKPTAAPKMIIDDDEGDDDDDGHEAIPIKSKPVSSKPAPKLAGDDDVPSVEGLSFAITGTLSMLRNDIIRIINEHGARFAPAVSKNVDYLICEDPHAGTAKLQKAADLGVKIVGEDFLHKLVAKKKKQDAAKAGGDNDDNTNAGDGPKPKNHMNEGDTFAVSGGHGNYEIRLRGGVYYCTCTAWKFQNGPTNARSCKHLKDHLGDEFEEWRCGPSGLAPVKVEKTNAPKLLLANKWEESTDPVGYWVSEKLDGVRAFWNGKKFISRLGNVFSAPEWFTKDLPTDETLDGELFGGRKQFQSTVGIVKSQGESERWKRLKYMIFDIPSKEASPFEQRLATLKSMFPNPSNPSHVEIVEQTLCKSKDQLMLMLESVQDQGGEGLMLRQPKSKYVGSRSNTLLKVKTFQDDEALVIGYQKGQGKYIGQIGSLHVQMPDGKTFYVGSGLSDSDRAKPPKVGSVITYRFQELTEGGIPRFPIFIGVRIDASWPPQK